MPISVAAATVFYALFVLLGVTVNLLDHIIIINTIDGVR
jgi:hypothetical protein